jgi:hypothetical protein
VSRCLRMTVNNFWFWLGQVGLQSNLTGLEKVVSGAMPCREGKPGWFFPEPGYALMAKALYYWA